MNDIVFENEMDNRRRAAPGQQWTVPVGGGFGRVFKVGDQPIDASVQGFYNVVRPDNGPTWSLTATSRSGSRAARDGLQPWQPRAGWHVVDVRDMNADGKADILLQNDNGSVAAWTFIQPIPGTTNGMSDGIFFSPQPNPSGHLDWHIA
jgi:hypothetical protein